MRPYFDDGAVQLWHGDCREILPVLGVTADLIVTDPPYGETSLKWDQWVDGWPTLAATAAKSMWCFGSTRMFGQHWTEFTSAKWKPSQETVGADEDGAPIRADLAVVWEKNAGTGIHADRFRRVHENVLHWYRATPWEEIYHQALRVDVEIDPTVHHHQLGDRVSGADGRKRGEHLGKVHRSTRWREDGTRLMTSVIRAKNLRGLALHPTEKPADLLRPLIEYARPPGGLILDLFAGSGAILDAARQTGRRAIGIEADERYIERAARRLSQGVLDLGGAA